MIDYNNALLRNQFFNIQEAEWITEARVFYSKNGYYPPGFLRRLLGNPCKGVVMSPDRKETMKGFLERTAESNLEINVSMG